MTAPPILDIVPAILDVNTNQEHRIIASVLFACVQYVHNYIDSTWGIHLIYIVMISRVNVFTTSVMN